MRQRRVPVGLAAGLLLVTLGTGDPPRAVWAVGEDPAAEVTDALGALGPPGLLWGRIAVEEESPVGPWTPLDGIEITLYPATPSLVAELERIRQSARGSGAEFEAAVARVQTVLAVHQGRIDRHNALTPDESLLIAEPPLVPPFRPGPLPSPRPPTSTKSRGRSPSGASATASGGAATSAKDAPSSTSPSGASATASGGAPTSTKESLFAPRSASTTTSARSGSSTTPGATGDIRVEPPHPWRRKTDPAGLFVFPAVPSGDWLVVAVRIGPYQAEKLRAEPKAGRQQSTRGKIGFLPRATGSAKEAEIWVTRVRVAPADRVGLELTDRARWLAGPIR